MDRNTADNLVKKLGVAEHFRPLLDSCGDGVERFEIAIRDVLGRYQERANKEGFSVPIYTRPNGEILREGIKDLLLAVSQFMRFYGISCKAQSSREIALADYCVSDLPLTKVREIEETAGREAAEIAMINNAGFCYEERMLLERKYGAIKRGNRKLLRSAIARRIIDGYGKVNLRGSPINRVNIVLTNVRYVTRLLAYKHLSEVWSRAL